MRQPGGTIKRGNLPSVLHNGGLTSSSNRTFKLAEANRLPLPLHLTYDRATPIHPLSRGTMVISLPSGFLSQDTSLRGPPLAP